MQEYWSGLPFPSPMHESKKPKWSRSVVSYQAPPSMGFSRQEYWSGVPLPSPVLHGKSMGKPWKQWETFFLGSRIPADGDCSHEIKRRLLLGRKAMTNLDSILKSRDITLPTKVHLVKVTVFPVVMYGCESWTVKKAESRRIDDFELWCWRRLLRVPLDCKEIKPVNLRGNQP